MSKIFAALPGMEVPVAGISQSFAKLWAETEASEQRAMQLNLVLHLGLATTAEDAIDQFQVAVRLAQRYPCRVVVLCPTTEENGKVELSAKIYGECFTGKSKDDTRCIEIVALNYPPAARAYLQSQVSVCLSTDLPLYYWAHRFTSSHRLSEYNYLLTRSQRVIFDTAIVAPDAISFGWPNLSAVRDLAYTRTLPLRQNIGQFLSRYSPPLIKRGLKEVIIWHQPKFSAEAACLLGWVKKGLLRADVDVEHAVKFTVSDDQCPGCLALEFKYTDRKKSFRWLADLGNDHARFSGNLGTGKSTQVAAARFLVPEQALAEAMFF